MIDIKKYSNFDFVSENTLSSVSSFLKTQFNNIFKDSTQSTTNLFNTFTKKLETDNNTSLLYQNYLKSSQTLTQNEINNSESIDSVNKILSESVKFFYFSLVPVVNKLQNDEFTIQKIFETSRDKRLISLMLYPEDKFSSAAQEYVNLIIPEIKKSAGLNDNTTATTEKINFNIKKILEAENINNNNDLLTYKKSIMNWINISLYDLIKKKIQFLNQIKPNTAITVDQLANQMKGTTNENAKKVILNKIFNMDKNELQKLSNILGLTKDELGDL